MSMTTRQLEWVKFHKQKLAMWITYIMQFDIVLRLTKVSLPNTKGFQTTSVTTLNSTHHFTTATQQDSQELRETSQDGTGHDLPWQQPAMKRIETQKYWAEVGRWFLTQINLTFYFILQIELKLLNMWQLDYADSDKVIPKLITSLHRKIFPF